MTAVQSAYTLHGVCGVRVRLHAYPLDTNFERQSVACNRLDSAAHSGFFQVFSPLSSDVFERKVETCSYVIKLNVEQDTNWEDHYVRPSRREEIRGVIERLSKPSTIRSIFGSGLTEQAKKYGGPMDLADSVALDRQVDAEYAAREKARKFKNSRNRRA